MYSHFGDITVGGHGSRALFHLRSLRGEVNVASMKKLLVALLLSATLPALAKDISASDASSHVGEVTDVCGTVSEVHVSSRATFIDLDGRYPTEAFTAGLRRIAAEMRSFCVPQSNWNDGNKQISRRRLAPRFEARWDHGPIQAVFGLSGAHDKPTHVG